MDYTDLTGKIEEGELNCMDLVHCLLENYATINILESFAEATEYDREHFPKKIFKAALELQILFGGDTE